MSLALVSVAGKVDQAEDCEDEEEDESAEEVKHGFSLKEVGE